MKKYFFVFTAFLIALGLGGCPSKKAVDAAHNSRNSLDWEGVYRGMTPAADCPGINVEITLNPDETYELSYEYVERPGGPYNEAGKFTWDKDGGIIKLDVEDYPPYFKVGQDNLAQLDMDGEVITGEFADMYILKKVR